MLYALHSVHGTLHMEMRTPLMPGDVRFGTSSSVDWHAVKLIPR